MEVPMRKVQKTVAVAVMSCFVMVGTASAGPVQPTTQRSSASASDRSPAATTLVAAGMRAVNVMETARPAASAGQTQEQQAAPSGAHLGKGAKVAIWLGAVTAATVWGYKTFSVTRGT